MCAFHCAQLWCTIWHRQNSSIDLPSHPPDSVLYWTGEYFHNIGRWLFIISLVVFYLYLYVYCDCCCQTEWCMMSTVLPWQLDDANRRLRLINAQHEATNSSLTRHVESLTAEVELLRRTMTTGSHDDHAMATVAYDDNVQFLVEQARQFRADFESEKHDRIAAEAQVTELRQQLAAANSQVDVTEIQVQGTRSQHRLQLFILWITGTRHQVSASFAVVYTLNYRYKAPGLSIICSSLYCELQVQGTRSQHRLQLFILWITGTRHQVSASFAAVYTLNYRYKAPGLSIVCSSLYSELQVQGTRSQHHLQLFILWITGTRHQVSASFAAVYTVNYRYKAWGLSIVCSCLYSELQVQGTRSQHRLQLFILWITGTRHQVSASFAAVYTLNYRYKAPGLSIICSSLYMTIQLSYQWLINCVAVGRAITLKIWAYKSQISKNLHIFDVA